ncbi:uncharacterized protein LOC121786656 [Salvia splendens]|uniref:uncharacterized protein LOC121786656 n=1 Tax=Salvia splendens TaxID=180675 RepID=UPI001C25342E|nr:uncharacterized protein LOC121786656 [Salvia splendens]
MKLDKILQKAHSIVILCLGDKILREVQKEETSAGVFAKLDELYMAKSLANRLYMKQREWFEERRENTTWLDRCNHKKRASRKLISSSLLSSSFLSPFSTATAIPNSHSNNFNGCLLSLRHILRSLPQSPPPQPTPPILRFQNPPLSPPQIPPSPPAGKGSLRRFRDPLPGRQKSAVNARRNIFAVPMTKYKTFPHRSEADYGAARVMLRPASPGTGVIAGGAVRIVLELAGVENALGKQLGSNNALNNARATVVAVQKMRQFSEVAEERGIPMEELWK